MGSSWKRSALPVLMVLAPTSLAIHPTPCPTGAAADGVAGWLCAATFNIPPLPSIPLGDILGYDVSLTFKDGIRCGGLQVGNLSSLATFTPWPALTFGIEDLSANCTAASVHLAFHHSGIIPDLPSIDAGLALDMKQVDLGMIIGILAQGGLPASAVVSNAVVTIGTVDIDLDFDNALLNAFKEHIASALAGVIKDKVPPALVQALEGLGPTLTAALQKLDAAIAELPYPPVPLPLPAVPPPPTKLVSWAGSPALGALDFVLNEVVGADGPLGAAGLVRLATGGTGAVARNTSFESAPLELSLNNLTLANVSFGTLSVGVEGLDHLRRLSLLVPDAAASPSSLLGAAFELDDAALRVRLQIHVAPIPGGSVPSEYPP